MSVSPGNKDHPALCPKCATSRGNHRWPAEINFFASAIDSTGKPLTPLPNRPGCFIVPKGEKAKNIKEFLTVTCGRCGYSWEEKPYDHETNKQVAEIKDAIK